RIASTATNLMQLDRVIEGATTTNQTLSILGLFAIPNTGGTYQNIRLAPAPGQTSSYFTLEGVTTFRLTHSGSSSNFQQNFILLAPAPKEHGPITVLNPVMDAQGFHLSWQTEAGFTYTIEHSDTMAPAEWQVLDTKTGDGQVQTATDSAPAATRRFYRIKTE
ncbi:MAG TPA: hypothetical protein P5022_07260, partial [Candidatus Paceibacterota bacterium]|nr:hypothetical protein [Candidatus Paceibacterota bacterium]